MPAPEPRVLPRGATPSADEHPEAAGDRSGAGVRARLRTALRVRARRASTHPRRPRPVGHRLRDSLLAESSRSATAFAAALVAAGVHRTTLPAADQPLASGHVVDAVLIALAVYQATHVLLTLAVYARASRDVLDRAVARMPVGGFVNRWVYFAEPGTGAALAVAVLAMAAAVVVLPQADSLPSALPPPVLTVLAIVLIVAAWSTMVLTFALDYLRRDHGRVAPAPGTSVDAEERERGRELTGPVPSTTGGLRFVDDGERTFADYLYVATHVATSFGTGDVTVAGTALRRVVTGQALVAFAFNAVIIGIAVSSLAALRG